jgi:hypothetical protein
MLQNGCFAASTHVVTHQQAQFNKIKSKQQIKNQNTNRLTEREEDKGEERTR